MFVIQSLHLRCYFWCTNQPEQIELLLEIVDPSILGVKWKQVSDTIVSLGGSYRFGPSTCKKQYLKLVEEGRASPLLGCGTVVGKRSRIEFKLEN